MWPSVASRSGEMGVIQRQGLQGQKQGTWIHEGEIGGAFALTCILLGVENRHSILQNGDHRMGSRRAAVPSWARP